MNALYEGVRKHLEDRNAIYHPQDSSFELNVLRSLTIYRLGEYKIIESDTGELRWESHFGFALHQEGRCFRKGQILFIGPAENERVGFLKREFLENFESFPIWSKTKNCCRSLEMYHCSTHKSVTKREMLLWMFDRNTDEIENLHLEKSYQSLDRITPRGPAENGTFRLQQYEITNKKDGQILWRTPGGTNTLRGGSCTVLEDVLFLGPGQETQSDLVRRKFFTNLRKLPKWDQTKYYSPNFLLY